MLKHEIHQNFHAALMRLVNQLSEIFNCAEPWIDRKIVFYIVTVVRIRLLERRKPQYVHIQRFVEIIQILNYPLQVSHSVSVRICKRSHKDLIPDAVVLPSARQRLLRIYIVVPLVGNDIVFCHSGTVFDAFIRIKYDRRFINRSAVLRFALTNKPMIIPFFAARLTEFDIHVSAVVYPKALTMQTAVVREYLDTYPSRFAICNRKPFILSVRRIPPGIVVCFV